MSVSRARVHIIIYILVAIVIVTPFGVSAQQQQPKWEQTDNAPSKQPSSELGRSDMPANISVHDMYVYVEVDQPTSVKLFTILGQPVTQMQLPAGTSRFRVATRGIYILKIGSATRRITI